MYKYVFFCSFMSAYQLCINKTKSMCVTKTKTNPKLSTVLHIAVQSGSALVLQTVDDF